MLLHQNIKAQMIEAMKAKDTVRLSVIRGLLSAFTNENVSKKRKPDEELPDDDVLAVVSRSVKQRKDSIEQFEKGGRQDLAESEKAELLVLESYLPAQMSREEIVEFVNKKKADLGMAAEEKNRFMGLVMKDLKGKADGTLVKEVIDSLF